MWHLCNGLPLSLTPCSQIAEARLKERDSGRPGRLGPEDSRAESRGREPPGLKHLDFAPGEAPFGAYDQER